MPRSETTFTAGNSIALKLTPEVHQTLVNVVATTGRITAAAGKCGLGVRTVRGWLQRGRAEEEGPFHDLAEAIERAKADFVVTAARRLNHLAIGGVMMLPAFDRDNNPIRDKDGALIVTEKVMLPSANALMYILDRVDPQPREPEADTQSGPQEFSDEAQVARGLAYYALTKEALQILVDLGVPRETIPEAAEVDEFEARMRALAIETTATAAPAEPAKESDSGEANVSDSLSETAPPTEPEPPKTEPESF